MSERPIDPARQGVSQEPEMEDKAITRARRQGFWGGLVAVGCFGAVAALAATAPSIDGHELALAALAFAAALLIAGAMLAVGFALDPHHK